MIMIPKTKQKSLIVFVIISVITISFFGCIDNTDTSTTSTSQQTDDIEQNLPSLLNATILDSILPDDLPGEWEYLQNYSAEGTVTTIVTKPGNHKSVITIQDKRNEELAKFAVTPENFSYTQSSIKWEWSETKYNNADAMMGTYIVNDKLEGELIAYPYDRFLVIAYIVGENDKIVKMDQLLNSLEFPQ